MKENYGTLSETMADLKEKGYTIDFNVSNECVVCHRTNTVLSPNDFEIDKVYRFEGESNPDDQCILYAITSSRFGLKGLLVNGYGISAVDETNELVAKLSTQG